MNGGGLSHAAADDATDKLVAESRTAANEGDIPRAKELAGKAIAGDPDDARLRFYRGTLYERTRQHEQALHDFDRAIKLAPRDAEAFDHRGSERLALGQIDEAIADFDQAIALDPRREPGHWKRGIAYYYAKRYADGRKQFEGYQTVDGNDVENAVWRFLCMARQGGAEAARRDLLKIKHDRRVPMMEIYALFAGKATPDGVLSAARAGDPTADELRHRLFYAELYLGLYAEALGDETTARRRLQAAFDHKIAHYMWDVAKMHLDRLKEEKK
ncbi:MAG: tetratricopeptide repeat protein [Pirellulales bacterium]